MKYLKLYENFKISDEQIINIIKDFFKEHYIESENKASYYGSRQIKFYPPIMLDITMRNGDKTFKVTMMYAENLYNIMIEYVDSDMGWQEREVKELGTKILNLLFNALSKRYPEWFAPYLEGDAIGFFNAK